jgi:protein TonB
MSQQKQYQKPFANLVEKPGRSKKWLFFPLSLILHIVLIGAVIVVPLMSGDDGEGLPPIKVIDTFLVTPQPPPPPAPPKGGKARKRGTGQVKKKENKSRTADTGRIVEPVVIPSEIEDEDFSMFARDDRGSGYPYVPGAPDDVDENFPGIAILGDGEPQREGISEIQIQMPKLIKRVEPLYPKMARDVQIQGDVVIEAFTDIYGKVVKTRVIRGNPLLKQAAVDAIRQWVYEPYILNGIPKPVTFTVTIKFRLKR